MLPLKKKALNKKNQPAECSIDYNEASPPHTQSTNHTIGNTAGTKITPAFTKIGKPAQLRIDSSMQHSLEDI